MDDIYLLLWREQTQRIQQHVFLLHHSALHLFKAIKQEPLFVLHTGSMVSQNSVEQYFLFLEKGTTYKCSRWVYRVIPRYDGWRGNKNNSSLYITEN